METKINIEQTRKNKIQISITLPHTVTRKFDILIGKDGLAISGETTLILKPFATNKILVDQE